MSDWRDRASCLGMDADLWFPHAGQSPKPAIRICRACPVILDCLDDSLTQRETNGIRGGLDDVERRRILRHHDETAGNQRAEALDLYRRLRPELPSDHAAQRAVGAAIGVAQRTIGKWVAADRIEAAR